MGKESCLPPPYPLLNWRPLLWNADVVSPFTGTSSGVPAEHISVLSCEETGSRETGLILCVPQRRKAYLPVTPEFNSCIWWILLPQVQLSHHLNGALNSDYDTGERRRSTVVNYVLVVLKRGSHSKQERLTE